MYLSRKQVLPEVVDMFGMNTRMDDDELEDDLFGTPDSPEEADAVEDDDVDDMFGSDDDDDVDDMFGSDDEDTSEEPSALPEASEPLDDDEDDDDDDDIDALFA